MTPTTFNEIVALNIEFERGPRWKMRAWWVRNRQEIRNHGIIGAAVFGVLTVFIVLDTAVVAWLG